MMKCLLLLQLLAFELVTADKLDRTYLPPPGAKLAGGSYDDLQTPLEYPKENHPAPIQNGQTPVRSQGNVLSGPVSNNQGLNEGTLSSVAPIDYSTTANNNNEAIHMNSFPIRVYESTGLPTSRPEVDSDANMGKQTTVPEFVPNLSPGLKTTPALNKFIDTGNNGEPGNYYLPEIPIYRNYKTNKANNFVTGTDSVPNTGLGQYSNQGTNSYLPRNDQSFIPKSATSEDKAQNYQPNVFGFYGGNPMIMASQFYLPQQFENINLIPKFEEYESTLVSTMKINQDIQNIKKENSPHPFQTPLVGTHALDDHKPNVSKMSTFTSNYADLQKLPSYPEVERRSNVPMRSKFKPERPQAESDRNAVILNYENTVTSDGYSYSYDTSNGIHKDEKATATDGIKAKGSYSYIGDDGKIYRVTYTADENGFRPSGDHLPTPPPIPEAIQKVIEQAAKDRAAGITHDGSYDEKKYGHMNYHQAKDPAFIKNAVPIINRRTNDELIQPSGVQKRLLLQKNRGKLNHFPRKGQLNSSRRRPDTSTKDFHQAMFNNSIPNLINRKTNKLYDKNVNKIQTSISTKEPNQNNEQIRYQYDKISTARTRHDQNSNDGRPVLTNRFSENQNPDIMYQPEISDGMTNYYIPVQLNQAVQSNSDLHKSSLKPVTSYDNGYYYVPPVIKFKQDNPFVQNTEQTFVKTQSYIPTTIKTTQQNVDGDVYQGTGSDSIQEKVNNNSRLPSNHIPAKNATVITTTRRPYISGPDNQVGINYYGDTQNQSLSPNKNDENSFTNDQDSNVSSTTPIPLPTPRFGNNPTGEFSVNQYYQTTINPANFDQTVPNAIENRITNIPSGSRGISVTQDFVTTTDKPFNLEVHQNVKIYGIGPKSTAASQYPEEHTTFDGFYMKALPQDDLRFSEPGSQLVGPVQDGRVQEVTDQSTPFYGNEVWNTESPIKNYLTGSFVNPDLTRPSDAAAVSTSESSTLKDFKDVELKQRQEQITPNYANNEKGVTGITPSVVGEDFNGPKQPQTFDPETGYYYR